MSIFIPATRGNTKKVDTTNTDYVDQVKKEQEVKRARTLVYELKAIVSAPVYNKAFSTLSRNQVYIDSQTKVTGTTHDHLKAAGKPIPKDYKQQQLRQKSSLDILISTTKEGLTWLPKTNKHYKDIQTGLQGLEAKLNPLQPTGSLNSAMIVGMGGAFHP